MFNHNYGGPNQKMLSSRKRIGFEPAKSRELSVHASLLYVSKSKITPSLLKLFVGFTQIEEQHGDMYFDNPNYHRISISCTFPSIHKVKTKMATSQICA